MSIESIEESFLNGADSCPKCGCKLKGFKKFTSGSEFIWLGWCDSCCADIATIHGNNPESEAA